MCGWAMGRRRRGYAVGAAYPLRVRQVVRGVSRPIRDRPQGSARLKHIRRGEHGHQRDKTAIGSAVQAYSFGIDTLVLYQPFCPVHMIV